MKLENGERYNGLSNNCQGFAILFLKRIFGDEYVDKLRKKDENWMLNILFLIVQKME
jgi:hypothetical protein